MDSELLSCPFCGAEATMDGKPGSWGYYPATAFVRCSRCSTRGPTFHDDEGGKRNYRAEAAAAWNTRAAPPPPAEQASGEHVEWLADMRLVFDASDAEADAHRVAAIDAAIAALSQRPVVGGDRLFKVIRSFGYTTTGQTDEIVDAVLAALAPQQPKKGEG